MVLSRLPHWGVPYLLEERKDALPVPLVRTGIKLGSARLAPCLMVEARAAVKELTVDGTATTNHSARHHGRQPVVHRWVRQRREAP